MTPPALSETRLRTVLEAAENAARAIPPVWPLASSVAVNPYLGQTGEALATVAARLARVAGAAVTMPRHYYLKKIEAGDITDDDLAAALALQPASVPPISVAVVKAAARQSDTAPSCLPTLADLAAESSGVDWPGFVSERFGVWAAGYFDEGQALWAAPKDKSAFAAWRAFATQDLTPEIIGLSGFADFITKAPDTADQVLCRAVDSLGLEPAAYETYFHQLLMTLGGWAQVARYRLWQAELTGNSDRTIVEFLAIRSLWDEALFAQYGHGIDNQWTASCVEHAKPVAPSKDQIIDVILQEASEHAAQRGLSNELSQPARIADSARPQLQAAFCIDVRSEVFRRALESLDPTIETKGFAGFFGIATSHRRLGSDVPEHRLPVLLNPALSSSAAGHSDSEADTSVRISARSKRAWGRFKLAAVSSFAFVEATGPVYVGKLMRDALGFKFHGAPLDPVPRLETTLDLSARLQAAETILNAMSLTENFARLILLTGHGANVVNNPHASALHCGACGGYSGDVNARLLAQLLNEVEVRRGLAERGITIPADTLFVAALHDTTTDNVTIYDADVGSSAHSKDLDNAKALLASAGKLARSERMLKLPRASSPRRVTSRSRDWSEVRPEWGLAGCKAFIAAPRHRTYGTSLKGRAFLHDYNWSMDKNFQVLELILTAPVVVASWISLQYYGSTVAPKTFGGGNKLLHNVVGGIGVVEGNGGALRAGLPWQSVHDGERLVHEPVRLSVCIEAPREAMSEILSRHPGVRELFDNRWLTLFALDADGQIAWRYAGSLQWTREHAASARPDHLKAVG